MIKRILKAGVFVALATSLSGCIWGEKVEVPPASVGMVMGKNGYQGDLIPPSRFRLPVCFLNCDKLVVNETIDAALFDRDPEEVVVDGLIDLCVFAIGTLDVYGVDPNKAWDRVYEANMAKSPGVKPGRPNPFGLPDLLKPAGWTCPTHKDNHGNLDKGV